jgi:hypothetical protein
MRLKKTAVTVAFATALLGALAAPPAMALSASVTGSSSWTGSATVYNKDTLSDSLFTSAPYIYSGGGGEYSLVNKSGSGVTVSRTAPGTITSVKACRSKPVGGMTCSVWNGNL